MIVSYGTPSLNKENAKKLFLEMRSDFISRSFFCKYLCTTDEERITYANKLFCAADMAMLDIIGPIKKG